MNDFSHTSVSMLQGMREQDPQQWERFVDVYSPLLFEWCRRAKINKVDAADIVQEVFRSVAVSLKDFRREQPQDSFHGWLWGITRFKTIDHFRNLGNRPVVQGGSAAQARFQQVPEDLPESWDESRQSTDNDIVVRRILDLLKTDFATRTWQAFWKTAVEQKPVNEVASELGMTAGAIYNARYRVIRRIREEFEGLFDIDEKNLL